MRKLKSIDEIYEEVKGCAFVLTNDAPLATALNKLVDRPMIGPFAMTSRQLAAYCAVDVIGSPVWNDLRIVTTISEETGLDFRYVHGEVERIREIRQYTCDVRKNLFTESSKAVYDSFKAIPTVEKVMDEFHEKNHFYSDLNGEVAVVGIEGEGGINIFNYLDKCPIRDEFREVSLFKDEECHLSEIYRIGNDRQIAENAVSLIDGRDPNDVAMVMNTSSPIVESIKTALYRKKVPFINSLKVRDLNDVRDFIQFLQLSLTYETLRVKHIREMFSSLGVHIDRNMDEHLLDKVSLEPDGMRLRTIMSDIRSRTFDDVRRNVFGSVKMDSIKSVIDDLGISDKKVCTRLVERLNYAVDNIPDLRHNEKIPDSERNGVLIADCRRSMFIDRPIVIYIGMGEDWDLDLADKRYIEDIQDESERMGARFAALIQQGVGRYYLVNTSRDGKVANPSSLFGRIFSIRDGKDAITFDDLLPEGETPRNERWTESRKGDKRELDGRLPNLPKYYQPFSQSSFSKYFECPCSFLFNRHLDHTDKDVLEFGNLIHSFAELYFSHGDRVLKEFDTVVSIACDHYAGLSSPALGRIDEARIRCAMDNIMQYIDSLDYTGEREMVPVRDSKNVFYNELKIGETCSLCESDQYSSQHRIHGKMDLRVDQVVDYKTGKMKTPSEIAKAMFLEGDRVKKDFQAVFYLALMDEFWSKDEMQFFFAMANDERSVSEDFDVHENIRTVSIIDPDEEELKGIIAGSFKGSSKCHKSPDRFLDVIEEVNGCLDIGDDHLEELISEIGREFNYNIHLSNNRRTIVNAINDYNVMYGSGVFVEGDRVVIPRERLEMILDRIDQYHSQMMEGSVSGFKPDHDIDCSKCDYFAVCTRDRVVIDEEDDSDE